MERQWNDKIFRVTDEGFDSLALEVFRFQYERNPLYRSYTDALGVKPGSVTRPAQIPFLPIRFFKSHRIATGEFKPVLHFESSGTTGSINSVHAVRDPLVYRESFSAGFRQFFGDTEDWCILGLLPSYLERSNSSLVYMADQLIRDSGHPQSGFYLDDLGALHEAMMQLEKTGQKTMLIGVTFALLDFAEAYPMQLSSTTIVETGGMKGRRTELIRQEVHDQLEKAFGVTSISSEYGMTELLSQAWSLKDGLFRNPPWMRVLVREEEDPLQVSDASSVYDHYQGSINGTDPGRHYLGGALNVIDLANVWSCAFIATDDAARLFADGSFEVLGRLDNSDLRGCSLLSL